MTEKVFAETDGCRFADSPRTKAGGLAFEVILKPAAADTPPQISSNSPPKERSISQEFIEKKLKDAEERRQVMSVAVAAYVTFIFTDAQNCCNTNVFL